MEINKEKSKTTIEFSNNELLVLFDWLVDFNKRDYNFNNQAAEQRLLWDLEALLEKQIVEAFDDNYTELLDKARKKIASHSR